MFKSDYFQALEDYRKARRSAAIQALLGRLTGSPHGTSLLSYDDVRQQLRAVEKSTEHLTEIPLDAIVGSVGRYHDFTRDFLPKKSIDRNRWARVKASSQGLSGLPPIEVYRIGEVYFVKDGNHRVSVARQMGSQAIQAYVTDVATKVTLSPDTTPDDLIIKGEQVRFLEQTKLEGAFPDADLTATNAGAYPKLLEHIAVHRYYMGLEQQREIPFPEAAEHWYRYVYLPVVDIIQQRNLLSNFPGRTAVDLYLWVADHRAALAEEVGWDIGSEAALSDLSERHSHQAVKRLSRAAKRVLKTIVPDYLESGPPAGTWRERLSRMTVLESLFTNLIVALDDTPTAWHALQMAILIAQAENSRIHGVHIHGGQEDPVLSNHEQLQMEFETRCRAGGIREYNLRIAEGEIWKILTGGSRYADLVVIPLNHPPGNKPTERLSSGISSLIRTCPVPVLTVPIKPNSLRTIAVAYDGSLKAREALFIAAYLGTQQGASLLVVTSSEGLSKPDSIQSEASRYLADYPLKSRFLMSDDEIAAAVSTAARQVGIDLVLIGGYGGMSILPVMLGSAVDQVLRAVRLPVLIAR